MYARLRKKIKEINSGIFIFKISYLFEELRKIKSNNAQNEYYLTDVIELIGKKMPVQAKIVEDSSEVMGINNYKSIKLFGKQNK